MNVGFKKDLNTGNETSIVGRCLSARKPTNMEDGGLIPSSFMTGCKFTNLHVLTMGL